jgi:hypothetical protein
MDPDIENMSREQLVQEVMKLRQGIREHRDSTRHELCWHHPALWALLPERTDPVPVVPDWPQFMRGCVRYRQSLDEQAPLAPRTTEELESSPRATRDRSRGNTAGGGGRPPEPRLSRRDQPDVGTDPGGDVSGAATGADPSVSRSAGRSHT